MSFDVIKGQQRIKERLGSMLTGDLPQSFLITGDKGCGKHLLAEELAGGILCESPTKNGRCGKCPCCIYFDAGTNPDIKRIEADKDRKNIRVEDLRREIISDIMIAPHVSHAKVYIINSDKLNIEGQNLLLKSLEEPVKGVYFILLSSEENILPTVMSRVVPVKMGNYSADDIIEILKEKGGKDLSDGRAAFLAEFSSGIPGKALELQNDSEFVEIRDEMIKILLDMPHLDLTDIMYDRYPVFEKNKDSIKEMLLLLLWTLGDLAALYSAKTPEQLENVKLKNADMKGLLVDFCRRHRNITLKNIGSAADAVTEFSRGLTVNVSFESACCSMLLKIHKEFAG